MQDKPIAAREPRPHFLAAFVMTIIALCTICFAGMIHFSNQASQEAAADMSTLYLRELNAQTIGHFQTSLNAQFAQLRTAVNAVSEDDLADQASLSAFLTRMQDYNGFSFLAFLDDHGQYHCVDGTFPAASKISFIGKLLAGETDFISYNETILGDNVFLLGLAITPVTYEDRQFVGVLAGLDGHLSCTFSYTALC